MELRRKFNKNKTINTSYRVAKKIEEDTKISDQNKKSKSVSDIVEASMQKQDMIIINERRAFVNKGNRQLKTNTITPGVNARYLSYSIFDGSKYIQLAPNGSKWIQVGPNPSKWISMDLQGPHESQFMKIYILIIQKAKIDLYRYKCKWV